MANGHKLRFDIFIQWRRLLFKKSYLCILNEETDERR